MLSSAYLGGSPLAAGVSDAFLLWQVVVSSCGWTPWAYYDHAPLNASWGLPKYMPRISSVYGGVGARIPVDFPEMVALLAPRPFFSNSAYTDFNFNFTGVAVTAPALAPVWQRYAAAAPNATQLGDALYVTFPSGGCMVESFPGASTTPECGHDFPDGTRLAAYEFIDRHLALPPNAESGTRGAPAASK